ncbi:hypothetical protein JOF29_003391 [Kribbella aluminosa]|uniref:Uncharacterized protein n=1 Tax=Kribbella aluminosa TaxID=416017 RepID=A0ABS4UKX7_9ACTN|nr:hypothetical protein [Kribbella aluminosa]MBP2352308.1 hypothetical protein [Kribbella aluminosa]
MEPLNLMVSLSHFAKDGRESQHGLGERAGRGRPADDTAKPAGGRRIWRFRFVGWRTLSS